jgi:phosphoenolpyruvate carboxykinase (ATP)
MDTLSPATLAPFPLELLPGAQIDLPTVQLVEEALRRKEGVLASNGALTVRTGRRTGRSPKDRFLVRDASTDGSVEWGAINQPIEPERFEALWDRALDYLAEGRPYVSRLCVGADPDMRIGVTAITELAWHNLFVRQLFVRPDPGMVCATPQWTLVNATGLATDPGRDGVNGDGAVLIDITGHRVLLCGMHYAGEMKKAMFTIMNFLLPAQGALPMHCAANEGDDGDTALFFGLSGTGKTTLSADPDRFLIGDDEHGWNDRGVFNFEGGCYAKCIDLSPEREPVIWGALRFGSVMENVVLDPASREARFEDASLTENTRAAYPREHIPMHVPHNRGGHPHAILFLTCDLYGVLPPVSILDRHQAAYHFLSGYTALVGSTEVGSADHIRPTFSTCFGAPFFPRPAHVYADLLMERMQRHGSRVYLVNTGWTGGSHGGGGRRFDLPTTRTLVHAIVKGRLEGARTRRIPGLNLDIPEHVPGVPDEVLDPRRTWRDPGAYEQAARELIGRFRENFGRFQVDAAIRAAGPHLEGE